MSGQDSTGSIENTRNESVDVVDTEGVSASVTSSETSSVSIVMTPASTDPTQQSSATVITTNEAADGETKDTKEGGESKDKPSDEKGTKKKEKPRVIKEKTYGIYTIQKLEAANFLVEWYKGFRASAPYMARLTKTYYSLSPMYTIVLVGANLLKAFLPSFNLWVRKEFLDQVQRAAEGKSVRGRKLMFLVALRLIDLITRQVLEIVTYGHGFLELR